MSACVFCAIVAGEVPAAEVYRDEHVVAFLDHRPVFHGHTLLAPLEHHETLPDLPPQEVEPLFSVARLLAVAVRDGMEATGSFVGINNVVSQSVPHLHVHVVPRNKGDGLRGFFWPRTKYRDAAHLEQAAAAIRDAVEGMR